MSGSTTYADGRRWAACVAAAVVALTAAGCSSDKDDAPSASSGPSVEASPSDDPTTTATPSPGEPGSTDPGPDATPVEVPEEVAAETEDGVEEYVADVGDVLADPSTEEEIDPAAVTGAALEALRNQVAEYEASGWRVVGEPRVVRHRVVRYYDDPEVAVVRACLDNSDVRVVDRAGKPVPGSRPASPRTLNVFTLVRVDDQWAVGEHRLATRPDC